MKKLKVVATWQPFKWPESWGIVKSGGIEY
jgi:hypothetical protein